MPFVDLQDLPQQEPVPGGRLRCLHSPHLTVAHWEFDAGAVLPDHSHPHEQVVNVMAGELELQIAGERRVLRPGQAAVIPPGVRHGGRALSACRVVDCFYPAREDYR